MCISRQDEARSELFRRVSGGKFDEGCLAVGSNGIVHPPTLQESFHDAAVGAVVIHDQEP